MIDTSKGRQPKEPRVSPVWAPRLTKKEVARLYRVDATGIRDEDLVNEVAFGILARCQSILTATEALRGRVACPNCRGIIKRGRVKDQARDQILDCPECDWQGSWKVYQKSFQHKQLVAGGMEPFFRQYIHDLPSARTSREKMVLIDTLIHRCHSEQTDDISRPGAINLIHGRMKDIIPFLDNLTYGDNSTPEVFGNKSQWDEKIDQIRERWSVGWIRNRDEHKNQENGEIHDEP